nr:MAG TPA: hypothetical protein [Crassvirales sp.]
MGNLFFLYIFLSFGGAIYCLILFNLYIIYTNLFILLLLFSIRVN